MLNVRISWHMLALAAVAAVAIVAALLELGPPSSSARTAREVITAADGLVQSTVSGTGNVEAGTDVEANFQTSGILQHVYVEDGDHVIKGQLLATLDPTAAQLTVDQAQENLTAAQDQLTNALDAQTSSSSSTATTATTPTRTSASATATTSAQTLAANVASAQASVDSAEASAINAENALHETHLYAPATGTVVSVEDISPGDTVSGSGSSSSGSGSGSGSGSSSGSGSGSSNGAGSLGGSGSSSSSASSSSSGFIEIVNTHRLTMTVALSESDVSKVKVGQPATVTMEALSNVELTAHVTAISTLGTTSSGVVSYDATLTLSQSDAQVKPGMSASAAIVTKQAAGVNLPNSAVSGTSGSVARVDVLNKGETVSTPVVVGVVGDSRTQIVSGLRAGQQVVVIATLPSLSTSATSGSSSSGTLGGSGRFGGAGGAGGFFGGGGGARLLGGGGGFTGPRGG